MRKKSLLKKRKGTEFAQLIKKLGNPQRLVWGNARWRNGLSRDLPATRTARSGDGIQEKAKKLVVGIRKETSLDDQRTDIKAASSHQGGSRLISEADLASIGMDNHQDTRSHSDTMASSPSSKEGIGSLLRFLGGSPC